MITANDAGRDLYNLLISAGFVPDTAKMITAQAAHETGNFNSKIYLTNNNPFGMKLPRERKTTAIGQNAGHAVYLDLASAVQDYKYYWQAQQYLDVYPDTDTFVRTLKDKGYFEASLPAYQKSVAFFYKLYFSE